ncbi:class I SAM-dependent methyltransferase [Mesorhizobium neociceri]|uniref:SAM-dependent methyltransferase n=1 Tax=Mesorhizobium neociceri TaxID=1307853 RepID=A0A838B951_9HYPH|nr:SAM-dependent methyltransferase [Mesorhizobium neociceri]MBA1143248.1 SAM-dependent methyltransferase [Mesorhizobium neociceri]
MPSDILRFFRAWMFDPLRVASITPSSAALARLMVSEITASTGSVIELGPGTGVFTQALIRQGVSEDRLILVEKGAEFAAMLAQRFPRARLLRIDAADIGDAIGTQSAQAGAVVSGLPLLSMPAKTVSAILAGSFSHLRDDGCFYQFTYGPRCPVPGGLLEGLGLEATRMGRTLRNIPPAAVYRIARRPVPLQANSVRPRAITMIRERV